MRRRPVWKLLGGIVAGVALGLGGLWTWVSSQADRRWEAMKADVLQRSQAAERRSGAREPLSGEPLPGSAWDDYKAADALIEAAPGTMDLLTGFIVDPKGADLVRVKATVQSLQPALDLLHRGARRAEAAAAGSKLNLYRVRALAVCRARIDLAEGRGAQALEVLLDAIRATQDGMLHASMTGMLAHLTMMDDVSGPVRDAVEKGGFPPESLEGLERELAVLDRSMPPMQPALQNHLVWLGNWIEEDPMEYVRGDDGPSWRYLFHPRLQAAAAYFDCAARVPLLDGVDRMTWAQERAAWADFDRRSQPPSTWGESFGHGDLRKCRARLRLLGMILHRRRTGGWVDLDDPFGATLRHAETEAQLRAWSVGLNGVDDGGKGNWRDGEDLLLEVPK